MKRPSAGRWPVARATLPILLRPQRPQWPLAAAGIEVQGMPEAPKQIPLSATLLIVILLLCQVAACVAGAGPSLSGKIDLRVFYASGSIVRSGHASHLYDYDYQRQTQDRVVGPRSGALPFLYPPFAALPFVPLSLVSYRAAFFVQIILGLLQLLSTAFLLRPALPALRQRSAALLPALYGCLFGVSVALMQGQVSFLLLLICSVSYLLLQSRRSFAAGVLFSLVLIKFQLALPVVLLFLLWRQWRFVAGFLAGAAALCGVSLAMVGTGGMTSYWNSLIGVARQGALNAAAAKARFGMFPTDMPNLHGLAYGVSRGASWGTALNVVLCLLVLGWAARQRASMLLALPAAMLVSYHMQPHDLTLLLLPLSFAWDRALRHRAERDPAQARSTLRGSDAALFGAMLLLALPLAAVVMVLGVNYLVSLAVFVLMALSVDRDQGREALTAATG